MSTLMTTPSANAAIGTIGHRVVAAGNEVELGTGNADSTVTADIAGAGASATLKIYDANGHVVGTRDLGAVSGEETALSILAEVVAARHGREGGRLAHARGRIHEVPA